MSEQKKYAAVRVKSYRLMMLEEPVEVRLFNSPKEARKFLKGKRAWWYVGNVTEHGKEKE